MARTAQQAGSCRRSVGKGEFRGGVSGKFEGDFGHSPFGKRRGTKSQYGVKAPGPGFGRKSGKGGLGASALSNCGMPLAH